MPSEQKALQNLLRAEATFRQIQVAFGSQGGGGGAGGGAGRDLASLFDLELDTEKNQYETAQTAGGSASQQQKEIDDALQKLDQLARRQEELAQQQRNNQQSSEQRWQQEMLRREAEELQRQMEQMAQATTARAAQARNRVRSRAIRRQGNLRRAVGFFRAIGSSGNQVIRTIRRGRKVGRPARAAVARPAAPGDRRHAPRNLSAAKRSRSAPRRRSLEGSHRPARQHAPAAIVARRSIRWPTKPAASPRKSATKPASIQQAFGQGIGIDSPERRTARSSPTIARNWPNDLGGLEKNLQDTARELATDNQSAASTKLREALGDMQQSDLRARIQRGADWMRRGIDPNANGMEPEIAAGMQRLEKGRA